eukprot:120617-Pyramimonas_sp.AAC.1
MGTEEWIAAGPAQTRAGAPPSPSPRLAAVGRRHRASTRSPPNPSWPCRLTDAAGQACERSRLH